MRDVALFVKSYRRDVQLVHRLLSSITKHDQDRLPTFVSVPGEDVPVFEPVVRNFPAVRLMRDEYFTVPQIREKIWGFSPGYITQQLVKLSVHQLEEAHNYVILDSDTYFIRDFASHDFVGLDGMGFTVVTADNDLYADPSYSRFREARTEKIGLIAARLGASTYSLATCHNNAIFHDVVLRRLEEWLASEHLTLVDLMRIAPVEFSWYHLFLQRFLPERVHKIEPFIKMVHTRSEYRGLVRAGYSHSTLQHSYLGVCLNSGWAGTNQHRYVSRLERGSRAALLLLSVDSARYFAAHRLPSLGEGRLGQPLKRLSRRLRKIF